MTSRRRKLITTILAFAMLICMLPTNSFAVTDNHIAADGTYTSQLQGYKEGKLKSGYTATLNVTVEICCDNLAAIGCSAFSW